MKLKHCVYGNSINRIRELLKDVQKTGKIKKIRKVYKYKIPEVDIDSLNNRDLLKLLDIESFNQ